MNLTTGCELVHLIYQNFLLAHEIYAEPLVVNGFGFLCRLPQLQLVSGQVTYVLSSRRYNLMVFEIGIEFLN